MIAKGKKRITVTLTEKSYNILRSQNPGYTKVTNSQVLNAILGIFDEENLTVGYNNIWEYNEND